MNFKKILGIGCLVAGGVLAVFFWDLKFKWFQGGPIGLLLIVIGLFDLREGIRADKGHKSRGIVEELRDDIGFKSSRNRDDQDRRNE